MSELYWYDNLKDAVQDAKLKGVGHLFTSDEVEAIWDCLEMWGERHEGWEKYHASLSADLASRDAELKIQYQKNIDLHNSYAHEVNNNIRKDDLIKRLVEAGQHMYFSVSDDPEEIRMREFDTWRALMKEVTND